MRILFFGTFDVRRHPRTRTLQEGLAELGADVLECNAPLDLNTAARVGILQHPWRVPALGVRLLTRWWRLWQQSKTVGEIDAVVVGYLGHFDVHLARRFWPHRLIALDYMVSVRDTALDRGAHNECVLGLLGRVDQAALRAADLPFVDTEEQLDTLPGPERQRSIVVSVGAPLAWFLPPRSSAGPPLKVIFFGLFTPLQGAPVIGRALRLLADGGVALTMVGSGQDLAETRAAAGNHKSVRWLDWVPAEELPAMVAAHDVCLGIFGNTPKALRVVPNKVYQGAAAGCAIVTSDTKPQRRALGDAAVFVPPANSEALAAALRALVRHPDDLDAYRKAAFERAKGMFGPARVAAPLLERLAAMRP